MIQKTIGYHESTMSILWVMERIGVASTLVVLALPHCTNDMLFTEVQRNFHRILRLQRETQRMLTP